MSFENSSKRAHDVPANTSDDDTSKRLRISHSSNDGGIAPGCFTSTPAECCVRILQFLDVDDLGSAAQVSRRFNEDSADSSLPKNRVATLTCVRRMDENTGVYSASTFSLLRNLIDKGISKDSWRFTKVKIIGHNLLEKVSIPEVRDMLPDMLPVEDHPLMLRNVKVLDLSFPSNAFKKDTQLKTCIPAVLAFVMPALRELDLSNASATESALRYFARECPVLEKITWNNNRTSTQVSGKSLDDCHRLKELYMDNAIFSCGYGESTAIQTDEHAHYCLLFFCKHELERVSLKNAQYREPEFCSRGGPAQVLPQMALVKFVRLTPSLRWFRSDLSPENVAVLHAERPEVTFLSE
jgi:hypothetical protein